MIKWAENFLQSDNKLFTRLFAITIDLAVILSIASLFRLIMEAL